MRPYCMHGNTAFSLIAMAIICSLRRSLTFKARWSNKLERHLH